jgi:cytochrome b pre-mRNA-processing protein 3
MVFGIFRRGPRSTTAGSLYGAIVAQSRRPGLYRDFGVPDTVDGRFDMIVLHQALLFRRLAREGDAVRSLGQDVFDMFCRDMDDNLREMGVGDLAVPKRMRGFAEAFYGRLAAYTQALDGDDADALVAALARNVLNCEGADERAHALAAYVGAAVRHLDGQDGPAIAAGKLSFPDPEGAGDGNRSLRAKRSNSVL